MLCRAKAHGGDVRAIVVDLCKLIEGVISVLHDNATLRSDGQIVSSDCDIPPVLYSVFISHLPLILLNHTSVRPDTATDGKAGQSSSSITLKTTATTTAATATTTTAATVTATTTTATAISGDGILALLQSWGGESTSNNLSTSVAVKDSSGNSSSRVAGGGVVDGYDGLKAVAHQLASSRAKSCTNLRNILQHKLESLKELL